jgi:hypothetical protein
LALIGFLWREPVPQPCLLNASACAIFLCLAIGMDLVEVKREAAGVFGFPAFFRRLMFEGDFNDATCLRDSDRSSATGLGPAAIEPNFWLWLVGARVKAR